MAASEDDRIVQSHDVATLTMNPALDIATTTERVVPAHKLRCTAPRYDPGGGGINVARAVHALGGARVQGRGAEAGERILADAKALEEAGAVAIVLELMPADVATQVSRALEIPTIGIGSGAGCDGQVLVLHDMLWLNERFHAKFVKSYASLAEQVRGAVRQYAEEVRGGRYPDAGHSFEQ